MRGESSFGQRPLAARRGNLYYVQLSRLTGFVRRRGFDSEGNDFVNDRNVHVPFVRPPRKDAPHLPYRRYSEMLVDGTLDLLSLVATAMVMCSASEDADRCLCLAVVAMCFMMIWRDRRGFRTCRRVPCPCLRGRRGRSPRSSWSAPGPTAPGASCRSSPGRSRSCSPWSATPPAGCPP